MAVVIVGGQKVFLVVGEIFPNLAREIFVTNFFEDSDGVGGLFFCKGQEHLIDALSWENGFHIWEI